MPRNRFIRKLFRLEDEKAVSLYRRRMEKAYSHSVRNQKSRGKKKK